MKLPFVTTRRQFLHQFATTLGATAFTLPVHAARRLSSASGVPSLSAAIDSLVAHRNSAAIIGEAYLAQFEDEKSTELLEHNLIEKLQVNKRRVDQHVLLDEIQSDFERGDIVNLHGWLLSRTEARICALFAI